MKLASLRHGRDGRLVVVSDDLAWYTDASACAPTMQAALDEWSRVEPVLRDLSAQLHAGAVVRVAFDERQAVSPLPRAYQWADGSAYVNHVALVRRARGAKLPESFWDDPLMYQGGSDAFLAPRDPISLKNEAWGYDFEAEVAVIVDDVEMGISPATALDRIRLIMLANDVSLRNLIPAELEKGFGFFQSKPASAFSPVALTPDVLGNAWRDGRLHAPMLVSLNGQPFGKADAGVDMTFDFGQLIAHAAKTRDLCAGTIIGSGTVSNREPDGGPGRAVSKGGLGYSCIAEQRTIEMIQSGRPATEFLKPGDRVEIEMRDRLGRSMFGTISQNVEM